MAVHAGRALFEQGIGDRRGNAQRGVLVYVYEAGTSTLATLYTDRTKATEQDNPLSTNGLGNLAIFADPGDYEAHVDSTGAVLRFTVLPDWEDVVTGDEPEGGLPAHLADAVDAHDASAVSFTPAAGIAATDVQAALVEVAGDVAGDVAGLAAHLSDDVDAHDASAVSFVPAGGIAATTVQAALVELDSDKEPTIPLGTYADAGPSTDPPLNARDPQFAGGAKGDRQQITTATIGLGGATVTSTTGTPFALSDVGKVGIFFAAGIYNAPTPSQPGLLIGTVTAVDPGLASLTLGNFIRNSDNGTGGATQAIASGGFFSWGTDDTAALQAWATALSAIVQSNTAGQPAPPVFQGLCPAGQYLIQNEILFGTTVNRTDGLRIDWGGGVSGGCTFFWFGLPCNDGSGHADANGTTQTSTTVLAPAARAADVGAGITDASGDIPANTKITAVVPGVSYTINAAATGSHAGNVLTITGGTYPTAGESCFHLLSPRGWLWTGSLRFASASGSLLYNRVGLWIDYAKGGGVNSFEALSASGVVTAIHQGQALAYTGGSYLAPTTFTIPTGQGNTDSIKYLVTSTCIESIRKVGTNGETLAVENCALTDVVHVRGFNGRGVSCNMGDGTHGASVLPFPNQTPNDYYEIDLLGSQPGGGGAYSFGAKGPWRQEQGAAMVRVVAGLTGAAASGPVVMDFNKWSSASTPTATRTVTGAITAGSEVVTLSAGTFSSALGGDTGRIVVIPGAGPAGATLIAPLNTASGSTGYLLGVTASTTVAGATITVIGLDNPLRLFQFATSGIVSITSSEMPQPGGYISIESGSTVNTGTTSIGVSRSEVPSTVSDNVPNFVVVAPLAVGTVAGAEVDLAGNLTNSAGTIAGRLSSRRYKITATAALNAQTTIAAGSNGQALGPGTTSPFTLNVAATAGFAATGTILVQTTRGFLQIAYTGTSGGNSFTGCTGGGGLPSTLTTGGMVCQGTWEAISDGANVQSVSATYQVLYTDRAVLCTSGTFTVTLPAPIKGYRVTVTNIGSGTITIASPSGTISGASSLAAGNVTPTHATFACFDGTNYVQVAG